VPVEIDIEHVARLARLGLSPDELQRFKEQLAVILEHAERVGEVAADDVPATGHPVPFSNVFRPDEPRPGLTREDALSTAPEREDDRFKVPRIVEEQE
jgi:aspartyl-tRNA(Asn)/glutamyl-tRNA(Gln) amidotransferase subunit C